MSACVAALVYNIIINQDAWTSKCNDRKIFNCTKIKMCARQRTHLPIPNWCRQYNIIKTRLKCNI